jgi:hypothetical protein
MCAFPDVKQVEEIDQAFAPNEEHSELQAILVEKRHLSKLVITFGNWDGTMQTKDSRTSSGKGLH